MEDIVTQEVSKLVKEWDETFEQTLKHVKALSECGKGERGVEVEGTSTQRLNGLVQDGLKSLKRMESNLYHLTPQLLGDEEKEMAKGKLKVWKNKHESLRLGARSANFQAMANIKKGAQTERELLLGGGAESTTRRRNLQTKVGMTSAAENITDSLRRTKQLMVQEVERSSTMLSSFEESTGVLRKAESEYKGHRSLLMRTRNLLSTMRRQDIFDRLVMSVGVFCFFCAVLYVVSKRLGLLRLQRHVVSAIKAGMTDQGAIGNVFNQVQVHDEVVPIVDVPFDHVRDEL